MMGDLEKAAVEKAKAEHYSATQNKPPSKRSEPLPSSNTEAESKGASPVKSTSLDIVKNADSHTNDSVPKVLKDEDNENSSSASTGKGKESLASTIEATAAATTTSITTPMKKIDAVPQTPATFTVTSDSKPKFIFGSAAKQLVSFNALASSESKADFSIAESASEITTCKEERGRSLGKKAKVVKDSDAKGEQSEESEDDDDESHIDDDEEEAENGNVFKSKVGGTAQALLPQTKVSTGEERETTKFSARAKLFEFDPSQSSSATAAGGEWRERGVGLIKVNELIADQQSSPKMARIIMRADGVLRLLLNVRIFGGMKYEIVQGRSVRFAAICQNGDGKDTNDDVEGTHQGVNKMCTFLLRFKSADEAFSFADQLSIYSY